MTLDQNRLSAACATAEAQLRPVCEDLVARFQAETDAEAVRQRNLFLFFCSFGTLSVFDAALSTGPIKYAFDWKWHLMSKVPFIEHMTDLAGRRVFEIGVGAGHMAFLLREALGSDVYGCDIYADLHAVYKPMREALGVQAATHDRTVRFGEPLGIQPGTEALVTFWPAFMKRAVGEQAGTDEPITEPWDVEEHEWFLDQCRTELTGLRQVIIRFNRDGLLKQRSVRDLYRRIGSFPIKEDPRFCVIKL